MGTIPTDAYLMIIGAMKCGTSTLFWYLAQHPKICPSRVKEPEFFSEHQGHGLPVDEYCDLWNFDAQKHQYALEASTGYAKYPREKNVATNIKSYGLNPRFIYIVRDPFSRIESDYNFSIGQDWFDPKIPITHDRYTEFSKYGLQLEPYRQNFGADRIIVLDFDELVERPIEFLQRLFRKLELDDCQIESIDEVKNKTLRISQAEYLLKTAPLLKATRKLIPRRVQRLTRKFSRPMPIRRLTGDERSAIQEKLQADMGHFRDRYGFPIEKWGFAS